jgi:putative MATE family efflux protein
MSYLTEGNLGRGLLRVAAPIVAGNLLQSVLELVDLYFVGRLGAEAIAGVALSGTVVMVLMTIVIGLNTATTAFVARFYGAKNFTGVGETIVHALFLGLVFSGCLSVIGIFFSQDLLLLLGADETVATLGSSYLSILLLGIFSMVELWIVSSSLQSCGDSVTPMLIMVFSNILNIILNPLLIFGYAGFPELGVGGAALATIVSRSAGLIIAILFLLQKQTNIRFPVRPRIDGGLIIRLVRVAVPNSLQSGVRSITFLAMMAIVALYGTPAISAYGIAWRMDLVALMPGFGIATGTAILVGQNLGADLPERAEKGVNLSLALYGGCMAILSGVYFVFARDIMEFFDPSGASTTIGVSYFQTVAPFYVLLACAIILSFALNGAGDTQKPMFATLFSMVAVQIPLAWLLPGALGIGIRGVWAAMVVGIVLQAAILFVMYRNGSWKKTVI